MQQARGMQRGGCVQQPHHSSRPVGCNTLVAYSSRTTAVGVRKEEEEGEDGEEEEQACMRGQDKAIIPHLAEAPLFKL